MADTPAWLEESPPGAAAPQIQTVTLDDPVIAPASGAAAGGAPAASPTSNNALTADDKELPGIILTMRLANMGISIALMACSILLMVGFPSISNWVLSIYATCGGLLICCLETQLKFLRVMIAVNFGFLFSPGWRFLFYMLLASVTWAYDNLFGRIISIALGSIAIVNSYILFRYPSYRKIREQIAEEEDKRIEARISKEVKKQAISQMTK